MGGSREGGHPAPAGAAALRAGRQEAGDEAEPGSGAPLHGGEEA